MPEFPGVGLEQTPDKLTPQARLAPSLPQEALTFRLRGAIELANHARGYLLEPTANVLAVLPAAGLL